jgi:osmoprotectant transport system permease protein
MVQLPLALPVIMAGIRISAVTAVGLTTIAALIGAGGLGQLIYRGISMVNNRMIIAGAVPAMVLTLVIDFLLNILEKLVTPKGIRRKVKKVKR